MQPRDRFFRWLGASAVVMAAMAYVDNQIKTVHAPYGIVSFEFAARTPELSMATLRAWTPHQKQLAAFSLGLHDSDNDNFGTFANDMWRGQFDFADGGGNTVAITLEGEESAYSNFSGMSVATGSIYYETDIDTESENLSGTLTDSGILSIEGAFEEGLVSDGVIASSLSQAEDFWTIRESLPLVKRSFLNSVNHDVSVPVSRIAEFIEKSEDRLKRDFGDIEIFVFGHLGDGNLHYAVAEPADTGNPVVRKQAEAITNTVHAMVTDFNGSISAEHGIGLLKRHELPDHKSEIELQMMRSIKAALDPKNILNPGRIFKLS